MTNGIIQNEKGFSVKDFETGHILFHIGQLHCGSYKEAVDKIGRASCRERV